MCAACKPFFDLCEADPCLRHQLRLRFPSSKERFGEGTFPKAAAATAAAPTSAASTAADSTAAAPAATAAAAAAATAAAATAAAATAAAATTAAATAAAAIAAAALQQPLLQHGECFENCTFPKVIFQGSGSKESFENSIFPKVIFQAPRKVSRTAFSRKSFSRLQGEGPRNPLTGGNWDGGRS